MKGWKDILIIEMTCEISCRKKWISKKERKGETFVAAIFEAANFDIHNKWIKCILAERKVSYHRYYCLILVDYPRLLRAKVASINLN